MSKKKIAVKERRKKKERERERERERESIRWSVCGDKVVGLG